MGTEENSIAPKGLLILLDVLVILSILNNAFSMVITNSLGVKEKAEEGKEIVFYEANPVPAENFNIQEAPTQQERKSNISFIFGIWFHILILASFVSVYAYKRFTIKKKEDIYWMVFSVIFIFLLLFTDFCNNLGYWIGVKLFM